MCFYIHVLHLSTQLHAIYTIKRRERRGRRNRPIGQKSPWRVPIPRARAAGARGNRGRRESCSLCFLAPSNTFFAQVWRAVASFESDSSPSFSAASQNKQKDLWSLQSTSISCPIPFLLSCPAANRGSKLEISEKNRSSVDDGECWQIEKKKTKKFRDLFFFSSLLCTGDACDLTRQPTTGGKKTFFIKNAETGGNRARHVAQSAFFRESKKKVWERNFFGKKINGRDRATMF